MKILSVLLGFFVGYLLINYFIPTQIEHGPDSNIVRNQIHNVNGSCYYYEPVAHVCGLSSVRHI